MKPVLVLISLGALAVTLLPGILYLTGTIDHGMVKWLALLGTIVWFAVTPFWMGRSEETLEDNSGA